MKIYLKKSLLEDSAKIEGWFNYRVSTITELHKLNQRYLYLKNERLRMQGKIDEAKAELAGVSVPITQRVWSNDPGIRRWQESEAEKERQAQLELLKTPVLEKIARLESELELWEGKFSPEMVSLGQQIMELENLLHDLSAKLEPFVCIEGDDLL